MASALLLVDVQRDMLEPPNPVPAHAEMEVALRVLLGKARDEGAFVVHVQNDGAVGEPDEVLTEGWQLCFAVAPGELTVRKTESDAFSNPALGVSLDARHVDKVVVAGMQSEHCVAATCRGALRRGLAVVLASGAHATYDWGGETAARISKRVEEELAVEGVEVVPADGIWFT